MDILVLNSGSSSIKYRLFEMPEAGIRAAGLVERIGEDSPARLRRKTLSDGEYRETTRELRVPDHAEGFRLILEQLPEGRPRAVGHRVVHGGHYFTRATRVNSEVLEQIRALNELAPLHNPVNLAGIEAALAADPRLPQVAVFDTAFHQTMPPYAYHYALPAEYYTQHQVRRYGFHGIANAWLLKRAAAYLERPAKALNLITLHLGNGASATAIQSGRSVDTSMGMTPLEGLVMGTRCGDLDPALHFYLLRRLNLTPDDLETRLNRDSGLKGLCGSNDMREILSAADNGEETAKLALEIYYYRLRKYVGAYFAVLGRVDALVFSGGVGENAAAVREAVCRGLDLLGLEIDMGRNRADLEAQTTPIHAGSVPILVIPAEEEREIAEQTLDLLNQPRE